MKHLSSVIQTLYLKDDNTEPMSKSLGFLSPEFHWMSWALSCLQLKKLYGEVHLYTNAVGYEILINRLGLPYSKVNVVLNDLSFPENLWAYPKLYTYSLQNTPFLHVDGDVFMWERLSSKVLSTALITQNSESTDKFYRSVLDQLTKDKVWLPDVILQEYNRNDTMSSYNAGIIGGFDIEFFKKYTSAAFDFINKNLDKVPVINHSRINMIYEQLLFSCLARENKAQVGCYYPYEVSDMSYKGFANFSEVPYQAKFIHLLGTYKQSQECCLSLAKRLRQDYSNYYYRVIRECKKANIDLYLRYYNVKKVTFQADQEEANSSFASAMSHRINWKKFYVTDREQHCKYQITFGNESKLFTTKFMTNELLVKRDKINEDNSVKVSYFVPSIYRKVYEEMECDELDQILIDALSEPKNFKSICDLLKKYFDEEDIQNEQEAFKALITLKLRRGCEKSMYVMT